MIVRINNKSNSNFMMVGTMAKSNYIRLLLIAGVICSICFSGCQESANSEKNKRLSPNYSTSKFEKVSEPVPTAKTLYIMANILASQGKDANVKL